MTALNEYQRLETFGIWHASPDEQRRDVIVQLGEATLTVSDQNMQALSHWSLPAVIRSVVWQRFSTGDSARQARKYPAANAANRTIGPAIKRTR